MIDTDDLTDRITTALGSLDQYAQQCHGASLALVRSGLLDDYTPADRHPRVARGACKGVGGQHSWAICGDVYDPAALIVDITLWSYDQTQPQVWVGTIAEERLHTPHHNRHIMETGKPYSHGGDPMPLDLTGLDSPTRILFDMIGDLDKVGWMTFWSSTGVLGWDAAGVLNRFLDAYPEMEALVPIDLIGHLTDRNPGGLYW